MLQQSELQGFTIPGVQERVIASLFADDTTIFMAQHDSLDVLRNILDDWCIVSGAKFNITKTEILPIGTLSSS